MRNIRRRRAIALFISLGVCMVALAVTLQFGWIILNWRRLVPLVLGIPFFALLIAGVILNTIFLVREVRRNEHHDSFLNAVTHELKTPVASIRLYLETLQRRDLPEVQRQEFYSIMLSDSNRLLATIEQVLKAGEVGQRARKNQVREELDLRELVEESVQIARQRNNLEAEAISIDAASPAADGPVIVAGDREDLQSALLNILDNAVKYSLDKVAIRVTLATEGDAWALVRTTDTGVGIPTAHLKGVFRRFYRVPNISLLRVKGTGLGLFLVRTIARQHGGDARAESAGEGKGTTIILQLPRLLTGKSQTRAAMLARPASAPKSYDERAMTQTANILIVEDEAHLAQGLLFNLQAEGYRASIAGDGAAALELLLDGDRDGGDFDAVLLDVMLPGKDGFQVLAELRQHERYVPVLMLTARGRPEDVLRGFTAGADDYLAKPFDLSILLARLKNLLRRMTWHSRTDGPKPAADDAPEDAPFRFAGRTIDFSKLELITPEKTIHLTLMESDLLRYLVQNRGRIVSRKELLEQVWRVREDTDTRAIDNFVVRLRRYLEDQPSDPVYLQTVRGVGYRFLPDAATTS